MPKEIEAVYERGVIRPVEPLELPEGTRLDVTVNIHEMHHTNDNAAQLLADIAALPLEGPSDSFSGREHDSILYPKNPIA